MPFTASLAEWNAVNDGTQGGLLSRDRVHGASCGLRAVSRTWPCGDLQFLRRTTSTHAVGRGAPDRAVPCRRPTFFDHTANAWLCRLRRASVLPHAASVEAWVLLP